MTKSARGRKARRAEWEAAPGPWSDSEAEMLAATSYVPKKSSRNGALVFSVAVFVAAAAAALACDLLLEGRISLVGILAALVAALAASSSLHVALGWEKVVVLRLGKLNRVVGPGFYATIPILEHGTIRVDQRIIATPFRAERTLTADLVPVNIDAVLFWVVWDAEKACVDRILRRPRCARRWDARLWPRWHCGGTSSTRRSRSTSRKRHPAGALISSP